jgi:hypothetical protein
MSSSSSTQAEAYLQPTQRRKAIALAQLPKKASEMQVVLVS